jgi:hypothetical protein
MSTEIMGANPHNVGLPPLFLEYRLKIRYYAKKNVVSTGKIAYNTWPRLNTDLHEEGGIIIEGISATIAIIGSEVVMGLIIIAYTVTITFLPLCKTIRGGLQVLKECSEQREKTVFHEGYDAIADVQGGLSIADGGNSVEERRYLEMQDNPGYF